MPRQDVIVRDPVVVTAGLPRFLAPGDEAVMRLDIANTDGPTATTRSPIETPGDLVDRQHAARQADARSAASAQTLTVPLIGADRRRRRHHRSGSPMPTALAVEQALVAAGASGGDCRSPRRMVVDLGPNGGSLRVDRELLAASMLRRRHRSASACRARRPSTCRRC